MRHKDPYNLLAGGKQQGEPLLKGGEQRRNHLLSGRAQKCAPLLTGGEQRGHHLLSAGEQSDFDTLTYGEGRTERLAHSLHLATTTLRAPRKAA